MQEYINSESLTVLTSSVDQLQLRRFYRDKHQLGTPVFMLHSVLHDGDIFTGGMNSNSGLAYYLARLGYDVYVASLRGKGRSWPGLSAKSVYGCHQAIQQDIPAFIKKIVSLRGDRPQIWIGHGWGSVLLCSYYARHGSAVCSVEKMVHFAARRRLQVDNFYKRLVINIMWRTIARQLVRVVGYMPAKLLLMGTSNESSKNYRDYLYWSDSDDWCDPEDSFDYGEAIRRQQLPPSFYFAAHSDQIYGDPADVREFLRELGPHDARLLVLSKAGGNQQNYGHQSLLRHKSCELDHFSLLKDWLR
ncbi:MAG: alpha/beta fold hydrolase [Spongiibacteraceae bacterium]